MQKMEHILWRGIVVAITAAAMFLLTYRYSYAEEISGGEVYFTHLHTAGCKTVESVRCSRNHSFWLHRSDKGTYHCSSCNAQTSHNIEMDIYRCVDTGDTWEENGYTQCSICGTIHSTWGGPPGDTHFYNKEKINCGFSQGERISSVKIVADGAWTNQGVTLEAKRTILKNDSSGSVTFSWEGGSLFVTENGIYTVNAVNGAGASVTASIEISCIDKAAPVILSVSGDTQGMTASGISVSVTAEDGESGLADAPYSFDGGVTWTAGSSFWVEEGRLVSLRVRDKAGNTSEKIVKRGDFPYPPSAPAPYPATPIPQITPVPQASDTQPDGGAKNTDTLTLLNGGESKDSGGVSEDGSISGDSENTGISGKGTDKSGKEGNGKTESGKAGSGNEKIENEKASVNAGGSRKKLQPLILKEEAQEGNTGSGFRVVRMDKAQAAGTTDISTPEERNAAMAVYMQAVTGTWATQNGLQSNSQIGAHSGLQSGVQSGAQNEKEAAGTEAQYALAGGLSLKEGQADAGLLQQALSRIRERAGLTVGILLFGFGILWGCRLLWLYSAELYCYDGGNEYRRMGFLHIRRRKRELELYLPDYVQTKTGTPRYRLVVKNRLVKRFGKMDLVVYSDEHRLRRPLEECVDFVL